VRREPLILSISDATREILIWLITYLLKNVEKVKEEMTL